MQYLADNIKLLRQRTGMTQADLSAKLGKTSVTISDYEKGKSAPPLDVLLLLCDIFQVDLNSLVLANLAAGQAASSAPNAEQSREYQRLQEQFHTLQQLSQQQGRRLTELEFLIRTHAPELAGKLGF